MKLASFRKGRGLSLGATALELGLRSKGYLSRLESGGRVPLELALRIQVWSGGEVRAAELRPDLAELIAAAEAPAPRSAEACA